jgi:hypothetical protein
MGADMSPRPVVVRSIAFMRLLRNRPHKRRKAAAVAQAAAALLFSR